MLSNISWYQFAAFIIIAVLTYYAIVIFLFYKENIVRLVSGFNEAESLGKIVVFDDEQNKNLLSNQGSVQLLQDEIESILKDAAQKKLIKEEIIMSLRTLFYDGNIPALSPQKISINNYIIQECKNICSIHLDEEDADLLWLR